MRIGELAGIVGVSTRTLRHYHQEGLLPEPARDSSGYRRYTISDLTLLLRIRRLRELGLSINDVRDVLSRDTGRGLRDVLSELDQDLQAQQRSIAAVRERIQQLLADSEIDALHDEDTTHSHEIFQHLRQLGAVGQAYRTDQAMMAVLPDQKAQEWTTAWQQLLSNQGDAEELAATYAEFDALVSAPLGDPRIRALADRIWRLMPQEFLDQLWVAENYAEKPTVKALAASLSPAQAQVMELLVQRMTARQQPVSDQGEGDEETA